MQKCVEQLNDIKKHNQAGHFKESFSILSKLLTDNPENDLVKMYLGLTYLERGLSGHDAEDLEKAKEVLTVVAEQSLGFSEISVQDIWETINWIEYFLAAQEKVSECLQALVEKLERAEPKAPRFDPQLN